MIRAAIVGCGKIADAHAERIRQIKGAELVGVYDREPLMARQLYERFPIAGYYSDLTELLEKAKPDVVHITTPPMSHFSLAKTCLEAGCHVFVEKPFTIYAQEASELLTLANRRGLKVTVGHDLQFSHVARRMRQLVHSGFLGDSPVHMESYYCYNLGNTAYARALLGDSRHWVRRLPGKLLQNTISHGIAKISEFLTCQSPQVVATGFVSPGLKQLGETEIVDELRVILLDGDRTTAYFTFSSQMRPSLHYFRIYGTKNGLVLDEDKQLLIKLSGRSYTSYLEKFVPPVTFAGQFIGNFKKNVGSFLRSDFHMKSGMKYLIESFYRSIADGAPVPIPYDEILRTATIMDSIFSQLDSQMSQCHDRPVRSILTA